MRHLLTFGVIAALATACNGVTNLGEGRQNATDGGGEETGGQDGAGGKDGAGGAVGNGGKPGDGGGSAGTQCNSDADCAAPAVCKQCADGSYSCAGAACMNGQCITAFKACESPQCVVDADCPMIGAPCQLCPDGSTACPKVQCLNGQCAGSFPGCGSGVCDPNQCASPNDPAVKGCCLSDNGPCGVDKGTGCMPVNPSCVVDADCPVSDMPCKICPDGTESCPWSKCEAGQCSMGFGTCGTDADYRWFKTCGDPVCKEPNGGTGLRPCTNEAAGGPCSPGDQCDLGVCGETLLCTTSDPTQGGFCPN